MDVVLPWGVEQVGTGQNDPCPPALLSGVGVAPRGRGPVRSGGCWGGGVAWGGPGGLGSAGAGWWWLEISCCGECGGWRG